MGTDTAGLTLFDYQRAALETAQAMEQATARLCLYYKTGAGKTVTGLLCVRQWGYSSVVVVTPPATYDAWIEWGVRLGVKVEPMSHARFRMKTTKLSRTAALIVDEFHLLGGHNGHGWKKLDTLSAHLQAPLVIMSATPNYNDAERVYCIQHVLDRHSVKGGYLEFLYRECNTQQNPFGSEPLVDEDQPFRRFKDAAEYLAALPQVCYLPDDLVYKIDDLPVNAHWPAEATTYGLDNRRGRIIASQIEERHARVAHGLIGDDGLLRPQVQSWIDSVLTGAGGPVLVFAAHSTVAMACDRTIARWATRVGVVHGKTPEKKKAQRIAMFRDGALDVLIGTATLATGTDGFDKVCDRMLILDDTDDDAMRRQLIGRIMPRGADTDASKKQVYRIVLS